MAADTLTPDCFTMKRNADSPFELSVGIVQRPSIEGTDAADAGVAAALFAFKGYGAPRVPRSYFPLSVSPFHVASTVAP